MAVLNADEVLKIDSIIDRVLDFSFGVHSRLGSFALESSYKTLIEKFLTKNGHKVECEKQISFNYDGIEIVNGFRVDLLVDDSLIIELKAVKSLAPEHYRRLATYLRFTGKSLGLLINFGGNSLKGNFSRLLNRQFSVPETLNEWIKVRHPFDA